MWDDVLSENGWWQNSSLLNTLKMKFVNTWQYFKLNLKNISVQME